jgi:simple sugar transport system ATP-binding protein|tara:strand:- start:162 stop:917 length:756 start_codon:yes stop_codon:yes gene_type:complete
MGYLGKNMHTASNQIVLRNIYKNFGSINALKDISMVTDSGKIHCILGDNGAGKSTLVNIISGVFQPDQGEYTVNEKRVLFKDPRQALDAGISTVYQNLAIIPIMNIYRNFFLGNEPIHGRLNTINKDFAIETTVKELKKFDINIEDAKRAAGTLSGGQRQILAIARALYFGAKILILDEPTSALGVRESAKVVEQIAQLREHNINVILVSHNIEQAFSLGDEFFIFKNGELVGQFNKLETSANKLRSILEK